MNAPTLLVGLGGTGSKIVCRVAQMVGEDQRDRLGFAVFDTDINELRDIQKANPFVKIIQTSTKLTVGEYLNIDTHARDSWFPVNAILNSKTLTEGAGQVRAISRLALDTAIRAGKMEQLHEAIQNLYKVEEDQAAQALRVIIVSSLAGGTGSGLILPVALYIKNYLATHFRQSANITRGFFILPEVFDEVIPGQAERNRLRSNAYATLRELDAFLMKGDATLPDSFRQSVKMEFPRISSEGYDEYAVRPYDFCFLFDAQNAEGSKLNSFNQYLDHAATCIYAQSIGPMNKRSNSSEDNTITSLASERGRNRYAGAGSSMLVYPLEDIKEYLGLNWAKECVSTQWLVFDAMYKDLCRENAARRAQGIVAPDPDPADNYTTSIETMAKNKDPFARSIINACSVLGGDGITKEADSWVKYVDALMQKVRTDEAYGQSDLDAQKVQVSQMLGGLEGGKESWEAFQEVFREMEKYRAMVVKRTEEMGHTIAYTIFNAPVKDATQDRQEYRMETYMRDSDRRFLHPSAVRYFLYKSLALLKAQHRMIEDKNNKANAFFEGFGMAHFDDPKTEEIEATVESLSSRKLSIINKMTGKLSGEQEDLKSAYSNYFAKVNEYRVNAVLAEVLEQGVNYVTALCEAFQKFFLSFEGRVNTLEKRISNIVKRYEHTKGTTSRYVCASSTCLKKMLEKYPYSGGGLSIDTHLGEDIYNKVRRYAMMTSKPENDSFFEEIFEDGILGFFKNQVMEIYGADVDMDIIDALEAEAEYELNEFDATRVEQYVRKTIQATRALSCPFIEKPLGEEKQPIYACTFNSDLDPADDSPRSILIGKELKNSGGVPDDDIGKNMILFYQSFYGLRANDLSKFAPPEETPTSSRDGGEYYKAYFELIAQLHPEAHRSKAITPHIDRWWHVVTKMPDLDDGNQAMQEQRIYAAFFWGLVGDYVDLFDISADHHAYRLKVDELDMDVGLDDVLIVSNGTPCDHLYEVLDAFAIYPELVNRVLKRVSHLTRVDIDKGSPIEEGLLMTNLADFRIREFPLGEENKVRSIFDIPILMKRSIKSELYNEEGVLQMLKAEIEEIKKYMTHFYTPKDFPEAFGSVLCQQFELFLENIAAEYKNSKAIYHDYLFSRTSSIVAKILENLGLTKDAKAIQSKVKELSR